MYACCKEIANGCFRSYFMICTIRYSRSRSKDAIFTVVLILGEGVGISGSSSLSSSLSFGGLGLPFSELSLDRLFLLNGQTDEKSELSLDLLDWASAWSPVASWSSLDDVLTLALVSELPVVVSPGPSVQLYNYLRGGDKNETY
jgi:hypothetical protein